MRRSHAHLVALAILLGASIAHATAPLLLHYQGYLEDVAGSIEGNVDLEVRLYDGASGGATLLWQESHPGVPVANGAFSVVLGGMTTLDDSTFDAAELWIELVVEGEILSPRQRLLSSPFAIRARQADALSFDCQEGDTLRFASGAWACACVPNAARACYSGAPATRNVGVCSDGTETCGIDGAYGACVGEVLPAAEICNSLDDDCDGVVDNGFDLVNDPQNCGACGIVCAPADVCLSGTCSCQEGNAQACYTGPPATLGVGLCQSGVETCSGGIYGGCVGEVLPAAEICNSLDDDCDGVVDNGFDLDSDEHNCGGCGIACDPGDVCNAGVCGCADGATQSCYTGPPATLGIGACQAGTATCSGGVYGGCLGEVLPSPEICNGIDDDCNGAVDDGCV